jgi:hypothetical protein
VFQMQQDEPDGMTPDLWSPSFRCNKWSEVVLFRLLTGGKNGLNR